MTTQTAKVMETWEREKLRAVTARFPAGCTVRRRSDAPAGQGRNKATAVVEQVVMTGVHRDVMLKTGNWSSDYLDPDFYEIDT